MKYKTVAKYFNVSAPGADTDAITDITWDGDASLRITIQVATSSVVNVMVNRSATEKALGMNANSALAAGALYSFDVHGMQADDVVNVQVETDSVIDILEIGKVVPV